MAKKRPAGSACSTAKSVDEKMDNTLKQKCHSSTEPHQTWAVSVSQTSLGRSALVGSQRTLVARLRHDSFHSNSPVDAAERDPAPTSGTTPNRRRLCRAARRSAYPSAAAPDRKVPKAGRDCRIPSVWNQRMHHTAFTSPPVHYHSALGRSPERCTGESMWYSDPECSGVSASAKTRAWARVTVVHMQKREGTVGFTAGKHVRQKCKKQTCRRYEGGKTRTVYEPMLVESSVTSGSHVMAVQVGQRSCRYGRSVMGANTASAGRADRSSLAYDAP